jgi:2-polyprenyl-3-methyl-5-hydroxy-6-metoxy-1,4-benzoquinol methylase
MKKPLKENRSMPDLVQVNCGLCGSEENQFVRRVRGFRIVQCNHCSCIYTNPRVTWKYFQPNIPLPKKLSIYQRDYWPKRKRSADSFWQHASSYRQTGYFLEIGCGFGFLLNEARTRGWMTVGMEIAQDEAEWGRQHFDLDIVTSLQHKHLHPGQFDVVVLWDVIEHIPDVHSLLQDCYRLLRPGGLLFLKTPNGDGLILRSTWWSKGYLPLYWQFVYPANPLEHIYHFTPTVLSKIMQQHKFTVRTIETEQDWQERILVGRNLFVLWMRYWIMWLSWKLNLPYEMSIWSEKILIEE